MGGRVLRGCSRRAVPAESIRHRASGDRGDCLDDDGDGSVAAYVSHGGRSAQRFKMTLAVEIASGARHDEHNAPGMIPGARETGMLTAFDVPATSVRIPEAPSTMDAATIAERQREGGGALSQRPRPRERSRSKGPGHRLHQFAMRTRALSAWRFRTNHV